MVQTALVKHRGGGLILPDYKYSATHIEQISLSYLVDRRGYTIKSRFNNSIVSPPGQPQKHLPQELGYFLKKDYNVIVLFRPTKDTDKKNPPELNSLSQALAALNIDKLKLLHPHCNIQLRIPVAETFLRKHWVALTVNIATTGEATAELYDPKGILSFFYPTGYIKKALKEFSTKLKSQVSYKENYSGDQGFFNNTDCGRYILGPIAGIENIAKISVEAMREKFQEILVLAIERFRTLLLQLKSAGKSVKPPQLSQPENPVETGIFTMDEEKLSEEPSNAGPSKIKFFGDTPDIQAELSAASAEIESNKSAWTAYIRRAKANLQLGNSEKAQHDCAYVIAECPNYQLKLSAYEIHKKAAYNNLSFSYCLTNNVEKSLSIENLPEKYKLTDQQREEHNQTLWVNLTHKIEKKSKNNNNKDLSYFLLKRARLNLELHDSLGACLDSSYIIDNNFPNLQKESAYGILKEAIGLGHEKNKRVEKIIKEFKEEQNKDTDKEQKKTTDCYRSLMSAYLETGELVEAYFCSTYINDQSKSKMWKEKTGSEMPSSIFPVILQAKSHFLHTPKKSASSCKP